MTQYDSWLETNTSECQIYDTSHKACCICEYCECAKDVQCVDDLQIDELAQISVKSFMSEEHICNDCVADILKKIECEQSCDELQAIELTGEAFWPESNKF